MKWLVLVPIKWYYSITIEFSGKISLSKYTEDRWIKNFSCRRDGVLMEIIYHTLIIKLRLALLRSLYTIDIATDNRQDRLENVTLIKPRERWEISRTRFRRVRIFPSLLADSHREFRRDVEDVRDISGTVEYMSAANFIYTWCTMLDTREAMVTQSVKLNNTFNFYVSIYKNI